MTSSIVSLQDVLLDDQDVIIDYDRQSADTNFSDDKSLGDVTIGCIEDCEDISPSCQTPDLEKISTDEHLKVLVTFIMFLRNFTVISHIKMVIIYQPFLGV